MENRLNLRKNKILETEVKILVENSKFDGYFSLPSNLLPYPFFTIKWNVNDRVSH